MTSQESFKRRIRARMEKTGERYAAARRVLVDQARHRARRPWVAEPEDSDEAVRSATGRGWDDWCDLIDQWEGDHTDHPSIAAHLQSDHGLDGWWAQSVTVGYERITGLRLPYQRPDGTFTAGRSRTVAVDHQLLRRMLLEERDALFPGYTTELLSRATAKAIRIALGPGVVQFGLEERPDARTKVTVAHAKLPTYENVEEWKFFWGEWLEALDGA